MSITRRLFLGRSAAVGAAGLVASVPADAASLAAIDGQENPALLDAWKEFRRIEQEHQEDRAALGLPVSPRPDECSALMDTFDKPLSSVMRQKAFTLYGVRLKADAMAFYFEFMGIKPERYGFIGFSCWLAWDVLEHSEHLDRGGAA